jgi:hypothetical protein
LRQRKKKHGDEFFDDVKNSIIPVVKEIIKIAALIAIEYGKKKIYLEVRVCIAEVL